MNAWPVVCITALAISKLALLIRASASTQTPTQASGPAARQPGAASAMPANSASRSAFGYVTPSSMP